MKSVFEVIAGSRHVGMQMSIGLVVGKDISRLDTIGAVVATDQPWPQRAVPRVHDTRSQLHAGLRRTTFVGAIPRPSVAIPPLRQTM